MTPASGRASCAASPATRAGRGRRGANVSRAAMASLRVWAAARIPAWREPALRPPRPLRRRQPPLLRQLRRAGAARHQRQARTSMSGSARRQRGAAAKKTAPNCYVASRRLPQPDLLGPEPRATPSSSTPPPTAATSSSPPRRACCPRTPAWSTSTTPATAAASRRPPRRPACEGEACQSPPPPPSDPTPASSAFEGAGNVAPKPPSASCPKGKRKVRRRQGRCVARGTTSATAATSQRHNRRAATMRRLASRPSPRPAAALAAARRRPGPGRLRPQRLRRHLHRRRRLRRDPGRLPPLRADHHLRPSTPKSTPKATKSPTSDVKDLDRRPAAGPRRRPRPRCRAARPPTSSTSATAGSAPAPTPPRSASPRSRSPTANRALSTTSPVYNLAPPPGVAAEARLRRRSASRSRSTSASAPNPPYNVVATLDQHLPGAPLLRRRADPLGRSPPTPPTTPNAATASADQRRTAARRQHPRTSPSSPCRAAAAGPLATDLRSRLLAEPRRLPAEADRPREPTTTPNRPTRSASTAAPNSASTPRSPPSRPPSRGQSPTGLDFDLDVHDEGLTNPEGPRPLRHQEGRRHPARGDDHQPLPGRRPRRLHRSRARQRETAGSAPGAGCPNASKIGTVEVETPLLEAKRSRAPSSSPSPTRTPSTPCSPSTS